MRRVGCGNKFEYLPASLVWNLAKSITIGTDTRTTHGQWERLGLVYVCIALQLVIAAQRTFFESPKYSSFATQKI